jgi:predicted dehydrogenase
LTIKRWIEDGAIGQVKEVHNWSSRPFWPQGELGPTEAMAVPVGLDWDMWVGPAAERPYHKAYLPFVWRGWFDFGCGSYGDMGCYSFAGIFKILGLDPPHAVEASASEPVEEMYPKASIVHMDFAAKGSRGPLRLTWYDGGLMPARPAGLRQQEERLFARRGEGIMYVGDKGLIVAGFNGQSPRVYPENPKYQPPPARRAAQSEPEDLAIDTWLKACKGGKTGEADFPTQAAPTESFLLGCMAQQIPNERFEWDSASMKVKNSEAAQKRIDPAWRGEWGRNT